MKRLLIGCLAVAALAGCAGRPTVGAPHVASSSSTASAAVAVTKVLTFVEENHGQTATLQGMPYLASLARSYGRTSGYRSLTHPSLPNYLVMAGGSTFGVRDSAPPSGHPLSTYSVFDLAVLRGRAARTYAEGMTRNCQQESAGRYAVRHNPWTYFASAASRRYCSMYDLPVGSTSSGPLRNDIAKGTLPSIGMVVPDLCHDAHDCSLSTADGWLRSWLQLVMAGPDFRAGRLAVVITFDEVEGSGGGNVLTVVVHPRVRGAVVSQPLSHYSWCRWMTDLVGQPPLSGCRSAGSLGTAFGL